MSRYTKEDLMRLVEEEGVEFIRLQFTDLFGTLKNMAVTASQLERVCNRQCMFDGSLIDGFVKMEEDLCLYPDLDTFQIFPWRPQQGKVARLKNLQYILGKEETKQFVNMRILFLSSLKVIIFR